MSNSNQLTFSLKALLRSTVVICGQLRGRLKDIALQADGENADVAYVVVKYDGHIEVDTVCWDAVMSFDNGEMHISDKGTGRSCNRVPARLLHLTSCVLGHRLLDLENGAVRAACDATLILTEGKLRITRIDFAPISRAGGWLSACLARCLRWPFNESYRNEAVPFEKVVIPAPGANASVILAKRKVSPVDLAELFEEMESAARIGILSSLKDNIAAMVLRHASPSLRSELIRSIGAMDSARLISVLNPAEAIHTLSTLSLAEVEAILELMERRTAEKIHYLLQNRTGEVSRFLGCPGLRLSPTTTVAQAVDTCRSMAAAAGVSSYIYVVDAEEYLLGVVSVRALLQAATNDILKNVMTESPVRLRQNDTIDKASRLLSRYNFLALPVVNQLDRLIGVISRSEVDFIAPPLSCGRSRVKPAP